MKIIDIQRTFNVGYVKAYELSKLINNMNNPIKKEAERQEFSQDKMKELFNPIPNLRVGRNSDNEWYVYSIGTEGFLFIGSLADCEAWIRLKVGGYL